MKKLLKNIGLFIPLCIAVYFVLLIAIGELAPHWLYSNLKYTRGYSDTGKRIAEAVTVSAPDVLVVGSSHAYRGFDPRIFKASGFSLFNLGSSSQTPLQTGVLLRRYLKKVNPRFVIYEVYPGTFADSGVEGGADLVSNDTVNADVAMMATCINDVVTYNTLAFAYYRQCVYGAKTDKNPVISNNDTYIKGGYVERRLQYYTDVPLRTRTKWKLKPEQFKAFAENIRLIEALNIPYVLVYAPIPHSSYNRRTNNAAFDTKMKAYGRYFNFNGKVALNDSLHFFDNNHLNQAGVLLFNKALLSTDGVLPKK